jgi:hypothetical protein
MTMSATVRALNIVTVRNLCGSQTCRGGPTLSPNTDLSVIGARIIVKN